jgi:glucose/arabinose dehydrogenase
MLIGPDNDLYLVVGDLRSYNTTAQNIKNGTAPDGSSVVYRITLNGDPVPNNPFGTDRLVSKYYAYGIRNSFGIDFDPLSGKLWDSENGDGTFDEINLVDPGFNSGWAPIQGFLQKNSDLDLLVMNLTDDSGPGHYSDPKFVWEQTVGPTAIKFLVTDKLGGDMSNNLLVGDAHLENLYLFKLNGDRNGFILPGNLTDRVANILEDEEESIVLAQGFGSITDIQISPDGYPYFSSFESYYPKMNSNGTIYKILPGNPKDFSEGS